MGLFKSFWKVSQNEGAFRLLKNACSWYVHKYLFRKRYIKKRILGSDMFLDLNDDGICRSLAIVGIREKETKYILEKEVTGRTNVIDIGANIGYYTLFLKTLTRGAVFALEPDKKNFELLKKNIALNGFNSSILYGSVYTHNLAMSNNVGKATMYLSKLSNVHTLLPNDVHNQMSGDVVVVDTTSLLDFMKGLSVGVDLVRMDIEGYEVEVLENLVKAVKAKVGSPDVLFEVHSKKYSDKHCLKKQLRELLKLGYGFEWMASTKKELFDDEDLFFEARVPTDATVRYVYNQVPDEKGLKLVEYCRTVYLKWCGK